MSITQEDIEAYAPKLTLTRHTGALLMYFQQDYSYRGDPEELKSIVLGVTIKNLLFGWWGIKSLFINPFVTVYNLVRFSQYKKAYAGYIANPDQYILEQKSKAQNGKQ